MRFLEDATVRAKLLWAFGSIGALATGGALAAGIGLSTVNGEMAKVRAAKDVEAIFLQRNIDHLKWLQTVAKSLDDPAATELGVQLDDHQCGFGKWFYGEGRQQAEASVPGLAGKIRAAEAPHTALHAAGREMQQLLEQGAAGRVQASSVLASEAHSQAARFQDVLGEASVLVQEAARVAEERGSARAWQIQALMTVGMIFSLSLMAFLVYWLSSRISGRVRMIAERVEQLRATDIAAVASGAAAMGSGDLGLTVDAGTTEPLGLICKDELGDLGRSVDGIIAATRTVAVGCHSARGVLRDLINETTGMVDAAREGRLDRRTEPGKYRGCYRELVAGVNGLLEAMATPINEATDVLDRVAARDLSARMNGEYRGEFDRIRRSLNAAVENLDRALEDVDEASAGVANAADDIRSSSHQLAEGTSQQASTIEEISSSLHELSSMARQNSGHAREARTLSGAATESTAQGVERMRRLSSAIGRIKESSDSTARIVRTIDEIAFQTNLLALNAAVEAARAGDAGKGFAVVAEEVRNLAMRSADAAHQTSTLIEEAVRNAEDGVQLNEEVLAGLETIRQQVERTSAVVAEIDAASEQQSDGVAQINTAVEQMNAVTQQTAAASEQGASTAEELSGQAASLQALVKDFTLTGSRAAAPAHRATDPVRRARASQVRRPAPAKASSPKALISLDEDADTLGLF